MCNIILRNRYYLLFAVEDVLRRGRVPPRSKYHVDRKAVVDAIRRELYKLKNSDGWVVLNGLPGYGKSVLAADSVRDASLLRNVFPGGVFWLTVQKMRLPDGEINTAALLEKLQNFILRVDKDMYCPPNIEAATDYLQKVMSEQHPRSLIILNDVWETEVAEAFGVRCRVLVTTRIANIAKEVSTPVCYPVSIINGLTDKEAKQLLAKWSKQKLGSLPKEAQSIIDYCRGSPLALEIIGGKLSRSGDNVARWKTISNRLKPDYDPRTPTLHRKSSAHELITRVDESISVSIEDLSELQKDRLQALVVFDYDTIITTAMLSTLWNIQDRFEAESQMFGEF